MHQAAPWADRRHQASDGAPGGVSRCTRAPRGKAHIKTHIALKRKRSSHITAATSRRMPAPRPIVWHPLRKEKGNVVNIYI